MNDRREGGVWTRRQSAKNALIRGAVHAALFVADRLPEPVLRAILRDVARFLRNVSPRLSTRATRAAARCLPESDANAVSVACFPRLGENLATTLSLRRSKVRALDRVHVPDPDRRALEAALAEGRGVVFVSAHHGPFELLAAAISELGHRPAVVVRESYDERLDPVVDRHRVLRGVTVIHRGKPGAATRIVRALRDGRPVGFLPDFGGRVPTLLANFLGRPAPFAVGPQQIARRTGAALVLGVLTRREPPGPEFSLRIRRIDAAEDTALLTQRVASELERAILESPADFPWMFSHA